MPRELHSGPAAVAIALVICVASVAFMIFVLLPALSYAGYQVLQITATGTHVRNLTRDVGGVLGVSYLSGLIGWIVVLALRQDGKHRLESVLQARPRY
jgi:hypothetical protein